MLGRVNFAGALPCWTSWSLVSTPTLDCILVLNEVKELRQLWEEAWYEGNRVEEQV